MKILLSMIAILIVTVGCAGAEHYGNTNIGATFNDEGKLTSLSWADGKEKKNVKVSFKHPNGTVFTYEASEVTAFEGQRIAAQLNAALALRALQDRAYRLHRGEQHPILRGECHQVRLPLALQGRGPRSKESA